MLPLISEFLLQSLTWAVIPVKYFCQGYPALSVIVLSRSSAIPAELCCLLTLAMALGDKIGGKIENLWETHVIF